MFKYARKNTNKWLNNNIQLHFIMKHFNVTQLRVLCPHNHVIKQLLPATSASCPVTLPSTITASTSLTTFRRTGPSYLKLVTHRRSVVERGGCFQRCLFVIQPYGSMRDTWFTVCLFFVFLYGYGFLSGGKRWGGEILHACWPTLRIGLLPFW